MRLTTLTTTALAASLPSLASAAKGKMGFALGTKQPSGACKTTPDYASDLTAIKSASSATIIRGYSASDCDSAASLLPAAQDAGFKVVLGIWADVDDAFTRDLDAVRAVAEQYADALYAVTVGSETLYRGNFTGEELSGKIQHVKGSLPEGTKVGTADSWNMFADGTADAVVRAADILLVNAFAFWQGASVDDAPRIYLDDMAQAASHISSISGSSSTLEVWTGETGWPTAQGTNYEGAKGGVANAESFFKRGFCAALEKGYNAFFFEAFDETWKPKSVGDNGEAADETAWGAMTADRGEKFSLRC